MSSEESKAIVQRFWEEVFNQGNFDAADEILASDYRLHQPDLSGGDRDLAGFREMHDKFRDAYPDLQAHIDEQVTAEGDRVVTRYTVTGTHPNTGRPVRVEGMSISLVSDGRIKESWVNWDAYGLVEQEGGAGDVGVEDFWKRCWWC